MCVFCFKQKTAYEMRISDWSSDVCSSDLHNPDAKHWFSGAMLETTAFRNSSLQGAYFIVAARAIGLDVGPMSGFDNARADETFFAGTSIKSNFIATFGYGAPESILGSLPRLGFDAACTNLQRNIPGPPR